MKKLLIVALVLSLVGVSSMAMAGVAGSVHDFSSDNVSWGTETQICIFCHTPHDFGRAASTAGVLWNRDLSTATYTMYSSTSLDGAIDTQPSGISKLCLSCHDGTVAVDSYGGGTGGTHVVGSGGYATYAKIPNTGTAGDLKGTHPISIVYNDVDDLELNVATATVFANSGMISDVLEGGKVQCSSCHDVHSGPEVPEGATDLLRETKDGSAICIVCHLK